MGISVNLASTHTAYDNGESTEDFADSSVLQPAGHGQIGPISVGFKLSIGTVPESVNHPFRRSFSVEVEELLPNTSILFNE